MWRRGPQVEVNLHETAMIDFDARGGEIERRSVSYPSHRHDRERGFRIFLSIVFGKNHPHAARRLLEGLDGSKAFVHNNSRLTKGCRNRSGHVLVFGMENARAGLKKFDPGVKIGAKVAQKSTPVRGSLGNPG